MSLYSESFKLTFRGKPATLCVVRNNGYCWGEIAQDGKTYHVNTEADHYDRPDEDAADLFIEASADPACVEEVNA